MSNRSAAHLQRPALRVLLVDSSPEEGVRIRDLLSQQGDLALECCTSLEEASEHLIAGDIDAVLVEHAVWATGPARALALFRARRPDTAVVLLTNGEHDREAVAALKLGANDFVSKRGLDPEQVATRIVAAIDESRTTRRRDTMVRWLERESRTDHLTGLGNRRAFDDRLRELSAASQRDGSPLTLIVVNVVGTRVVNEAHGYEVGDAMIRRAGFAISRSVRTSDCAARIGGDDFGVLLPGGDFDLGCRVARRIAHEVERLNGDADWDGELPVSLTFGVASGSGCDPADLLANADVRTATAGVTRKLVSPFRFREDSDGPSVA